MEHLSGRLQGDIHVYLPPWQLLSRSQVTPTWMGRCRQCSSHTTHAVMQLEVGNVLLVLFCFVSPHQRIFFPH